MVHCNAGRGGETITIKTAALYIDPSGGLLYKLIRHLSLMNSKKHVIPLHSLYWSIHIKDESTHGSVSEVLLDVNLIGIHIFVKSIQGCLQSMMNSMQTCNSVTFYIIKKKLIF